jgi:hypothetical protein
LLVPVATLMILVLVLVSAIQAAILHERRNDLPDSEFERTAVLFGTSLLLRRSFGQALIFAADGAERDVREIMLVLSNSPAPPVGAGLAVRPAPCVGIDLDVERCFEAVLVHQSAEVPPGIYFGLARVDDEPRVVFVRSTFQTARAGPPTTC